MKTNDVVIKKDCPVLFENSIGLSRTLSLILGGVNATCYALSTLLSFVFVERAGRRKMFLVGTAGQTVAMIITFSCLLAGGTENAKGAAFGLFLFIVFFGSTWLELPWLYPAELSPLRTRTRANAISTSTNWIFNFLSKSFRFLPAILERRWTGLGGL